MRKLYTTILVSFICISFYFLVFAGINSNSNSNSNSNTLTSDVTNVRIDPPQSQPKNFINCIFNDAYEAWNHQTWVLKFLDRYSDSLHFNSIHYYNYIHTSNYYGSFNQLMDSSQITNNVNLLNSVEGKGLKTFTARQNIEKYCYGQRLVYEVSPAGSTTINNGFCYQNVMPNTYEPFLDSGRTVLHAKPWPHEDNNSPGWLCKGIYENLQHSDLYDFVQLDAFTWHLKPMMRIDSSIFSTSNTTPVVAVVVSNYEGDRIDSIIIRVNNFRSSSNDYLGQYVDKFIFADPTPDSLLTSGSPMNGLGAGRDDDYNLWKNNCKVDFKVYWFGEVEVWFDKMTVDDEPANDLFTGIRDTLIKQEAIELGSHSANLAFFADEVTYSNIPNVRYVDSVLKSANSNAKLHTAVTNYFQVRGLKNDNIGHSVYFQNVELNSVSADAHEM